MSQGAGATATTSETTANQQPVRRQFSADAFRALTLRLQGKASAVEQSTLTVPPPQSQGPDSNFESPPAAAPQPVDLEPEIAAPPAVAPATPPAPAKIDDIMVQPGMSAPLDEPAADASPTSPSLETLAQAATPAPAPVAAMGADTDGAADPLTTGPLPQRASLQESVVATQQPPVLQSPPDLQEFQVPPQSTALQEPAREQQSAPFPPPLVESGPTNLAGLANLQKPVTPDPSQPLAQPLDSAEPSLLSALDSLATEESETPPSTQPTEPSQMAEQIAAEVPQAINDSPAKTSFVVDEDANRAFEQQLQALKRQSHDRLKPQSEAEKTDVAPTGEGEDGEQRHREQQEQESQPQAKYSAKTPPQPQPQVDPLVAAMQLLDQQQPAGDPAASVETAIPDLPVLDGFDTLTVPVESTDLVHSEAVTAPLRQKSEAVEPEPASVQTALPSEPTSHAQANNTQTSETPAAPTQAQAAVREQTAGTQASADLATVQPDRVEPVVTDPAPAARTPLESAGATHNKADTAPKRRLSEAVSPDPGGSETMPPKSAAQTAPKPEQQIPAIDEPDKHVAKDPKSGETARALLDMMSMPSGASQPHERSLAADTLLQLFPKMPERDLVALSERVCLMEDPPSLLVKKLINHTSAKVAQPLLEGAKSIDEQELLKLVATCDNERLLMISKRRQISSSICDALIVRGEATVNLTLARNPGARFSHDAFVTLCEIAKTQPTLQAPLATRGDTPAPIAFELFWFLPTELRRYVLSRFLTDSSTLDKILKIAKNVDSSGNDQPEEAKFPSKRAVEILVDLLVEGVADQPAEVMAEMAGICVENARRIIADPDGEPLTVAFKTIGLSRNQFEEAIKRCISSPNMLLRPDRSVTELQSLFDSLSFNKARTLITYWDWAIEKSGPYARRVG